MLGSGRRARSDMIPQHGKILYIKIKICYQSLIHADVSSKYAMDWADDANVHDGSHGHNHFTTTQISVIPEPDGKINRARTGHAVS